MISFVEIKQMKCAEFVQRYKKQRLPEINETFYSVFDTTIVRSRYKFTAFLAYIIEGVIL